VRFSIHASGHTSSMSRAMPTSTGTLRSARTIPPGPTVSPTDWRMPNRSGTSYPAGIGVSRDGTHLYVAENLFDSLAVIDVATKRVVQRFAGGALLEVELAYIRFVLEATGGSQTRAAEVLGISRKALWEKRRRHGIG